MNIFQEKLRLLKPSPTSFAVRLYRECGQGTGNIVCSPVSVRNVMAMVREGAAGATRDEMTRVLGIEHEEDAGLFCQATDSVPSRVTLCELYEANGLWAQMGYPFHQAFLDTLARRYGSRLHLEDFQQDALRALEHINVWVKGNTKGMIPALLNAQAVTECTRLVLVNALYFKGVWHREFRKENTRQERFTNQDGTNNIVSMMNQQTTFGHATMPEFQALELPYKAPRYSMLVLLPHSSAGLARLEGGLSVATLTECLARLEPKEVQVTLPAFKARRHINLGSALQQMGIRTAFSEGADFSAMTPNKDFHISEVVHEALVDVFEEGTRAAAATALVMRMTCCQPAHKPVVFRADHPFLFLILDWSSGEILFMGRVSEM